MIDTPGINYWRDFPDASAPVNWIRWGSSIRGLDCWEADERRAARDVIDAAEKFAYGDPDGAVAALVASTAPTPLLAQVAVFFVTALIAFAEDRRGMAEDMSARVKMRSGSTFAADAMTLIAIAEATAGFLMEEVDAEPVFESAYTDDLSRMHRLLRECPTPLAKTAVAACRIVGAIWDEQPGSFDAMRHNFRDVA
ncbi:hypothetical protein C0J29_13785 [Mycobacterium paragordonae]|uniref:Uncharacterized protein n=1 Tax=Mycobacterium paragordonae TaxID=1389713 RepID=A0ABQ1C3F3_9MYCO|nr:hypothetical protein [Mycobacterium paragordonae]AYE95716.1 hypothetical protein C0J29_13785 [Mycobacterium paragordonae]GFG78983.1 hypothetical protein MPRG_22590 [Mycobacterium paragordonae]